MDKFIETYSREARSWSELLQQAARYNAETNVANHIDEDVRNSVFNNPDYQGRFPAMESLAGGNLQYAEAPWLHGAFPAFAGWSAGSFTHPWFGTEAEQTTKATHFLSVPAEYKCPIYWFSFEDNCVYEGTAKYDCVDKTKILYNMHNTMYCAPKHISFILKWRKVTRPVKRGVYLQGAVEIISWIQNPYYRKYLIDVCSKVTSDKYGGSQQEIIGEGAAFIVTHPEIELLAKMRIAGTTSPAMLSKFFDTAYSSHPHRSFYSSRARATDSELSAWNRTFKEGKNLKEIISLPMPLIEYLWNIPDINVWDNVRKMWSLRDCTPDDIIQLLNTRDNVTISKIDEILRAKYQDKPIFSLTTLFNYLNRLDVYQGLSRTEALDLIRDCLAMSRRLEEAPDFIEKDSIEREHRLLMRRQTAVRNEKITQGIKAACTDKFAFENKQFFVRQIRDYDDLKKEGDQQHNCLVWAYDRRVADGTSLIYVIRAKKYPDISLISIELDPTGRFIRQKYLAYNKPVTDKQQLEFIDQWNDFRNNLLDAENVGETA